VVRDTQFEKPFLRSQTSVEWQTCSFLSKALLAVPKTTCALWSNHLYLTDTMCSKETQPTLNNKVGHGLSIWCRPPLYRAVGKETTLIPLWDKRRAATETFRVQRDRRALQITNATQGICSETARKGIKQRIWVYYVFLTKTHDKNCQRCYFGSRNVPFMAFVYTFSLAHAEISIKNLFCFTCSRCIFTLRGPEVVTLSDKWH
jgi:hypothetical protein